MKCPRCGLHSQDIAERCDCGYDFKTGKLEASSLVADADTLLEQSGKSTMRYGAILFLVGAGMTALMSLTVAGESQIRSIGSSIFLVALVLGALRFLRGYREYQQGRRLAARGRPPETSLRDE